MRRWVNLILTVAVMLATLTVGVFAADPADPADPVTLDNGLVLTKEASSWTITGYTGQGGVLMIPEEYEGSKITKIGAEAFKKTDHGKKLTEVILPCTISEVGNSAFDNCTGLETVIFLKPKAGSTSTTSVSIAERAFVNCSALTDLILPEKLNTVGRGAFNGAKSLQAVVIPEEVNKIEPTAFANSGLKTIFIPDNFASGSSKISRGAFDQLETIHFGSLDISGIWSCFDGPPPVNDPGTDVHSAVYNREMALPECNELGNVVGGASCDSQGDAHKDSCDLLSKSLSIPKLGHKWVTDPGRPVETKDATCKEPGEIRTPQKCSVCGEAGEPKIEVVPKLTTHTYDDDSETVEKDLFPGNCSGTKGLSMVTKKCAVCGDYTPVCFTCEELRLALEEADAELEEAQEVLAEATAKLEAAAAAKEQAEAAKTAADEALTAAQKAKTEAADAYTAAQGKTAEAQAVLDAAVTDAEKEAAQKALDAAKAEEEEAKRASQAADRAVLEREIAQEEAQAALTEAGAAYTTAETEKTAAEGAVNNTAVSTAQEDLRTHLMSTTTHTECAECLELLGDIRTAKSDSAKQKAEDAYAAHKGDSSAHKPDNIPAGAISGKEADGAPEHDWGEPEVPKDVQRPVCGSGISIKVVPTYTCKVCGATKDGKAEILDAAPEHKLPAKPEIDFSQPATCTEDGKTVYKDYTCETCNTLVTGEERVTPASGHKWVDKPELDEIIRQPSCVDGGLKNTYRVCENENCPLKGAPQLKESNVPVEPNPLGHDWGNFVPDEGQDMTPNETCVEKQVTGTVSCSRNCGVEPERRTLTIEGLGNHNYEGSEWVTVKEATATEDGLRQRSCMNEGCTHMDEEVIPATGIPDEPEDPDDPDDPDTPTEPEQPATYRVDVVQASNGTTSVNRTTAQSGDRVTITISPASDYELDMLRVISADGRVLNPDSLGSGQYRFTMPAANVEVRATFSRKSSSSWSGSNWASAPGEGTNGDARRTTDVMPTQNPSQSVPKAGASEQVFRDIPTGHWAAGEINWANQMGYMNGTAGRFNPDGNITHQQMWMVLARITGNQPANMTEARRWAVEHSFADGSSPTAAVSRHQLVTALYRCAHLMGSTNRNTTSLAGYADSRTVPTAARDAFSWAVANGIVSGTANGRLDPNGTLTRAQFAVILYRYSQRI